MVILTLIVSDKERIDDIVKSVLKNNFALNVMVGDARNCYWLETSGVKTQGEIYTIQFATKSLLFEEIKTSLQNEFPGTNLFIFANPIVHMNAPFYDDIKSGVTGLNTTGKEKDAIVFTNQGSNI